MFEFGEIVDIDAVRGYVKVYIQESGNTTEWIPFVRFHYATSIPVEINEQVLVGQTKSGRSFVIGSTPNNVDKPYFGASANKLGVRFSDNCLVEYDAAQSVLTITTSGSVNITAAEANVSAPDILLNGDVNIVGTLNATGNIESSADVIAGSVHLKTHKHSGVTTGGGISGIAI
jgi:phage baseplate assembly protein V